MFNGGFSTYKIPKSHEMAHLFILMYLITTVNREIFRENFIFANSVKRHICDAKYSRLEHDFPISVNNRVISPFREEFIFTKCCICICKVSRK